MPPPFLCLSPPLHALSTPSLEISFSPQSPSALKIQDGSQMFCKEILSTISPKILNELQPCSEKLSEMLGGGGREGGTLRMD